MNISINLSTRLHYNRRGLRLALLASTTILAFFVIMLLLRISYLRHEKARLSSDIIKMEQQLTGQSADVSQNDFKVRKELVSSVNLLLERRAANVWIALLDAVEEVVPDGISISRLAPEKKDGLLKLEGRARTLGTIRHLLENLEKSTSFKDPMLVSHSDIIIGDRVQGIQFFITAKMVQR